MASPALLGIGVALLLLGCAGEDQARTVPTQPAEPGPRQFVPGEYIVTVCSTGDGDAVHAVYAAYGIEELQALGRGRFLIRLGRDPGLEAVRRTGLASEHVTAVERNFVYRYQR